MANSATPRRFEYTASRYAAIVLVAVITPGLVLAVLVIAWPGPAAADAAAERCNDFSDPARQARGCTAYIRQAHVAPSNLAVAYANRGIARSALHNSREAFGDFSQAIGLAPEWAGPYFNRANIAYERRQFADAIADYSAAIARDDRLAFAYLNRGRALAALGDRPRARADFARALELDPGLAAASAQIEALGPIPDATAPPDTPTE